MHTLRESTQKVERKEGNVQYRFLAAASKVPHSFAGRFMNLAGLPLYTLSHLVSAIYEISRQS